ncbi:MAG: hypothetical protein GX817_02150 [Elusimicrobia bacterium]|nr:hypothetical protein [Elusimicrobiota bacterium]
MEIFIFGAGASHAASNKNIPLGADLCWDYANTCCGPIFERDNYGNILSSSIEEANKLFEPFIRFLLILGNYYPYVKKEIVKIEEANKMALQYLPPPTLAKYSGNYSDWIKEGKKYCVDEFITKIIDSNNYDDLEGIKRFIFEHIVETSNYWGYQSNNLYEKFVDKYIYGKKPEEVKVISFNFDTLLEYSKVHSKKKTFFKYHLNETFNFIDEHGFDLSNAYTIYKLHGSVHWWCCPDCQIVHINSPFLDKDVYGSFSCDKCKTSMTPMILAPREASNKLLPRLLDKAKKELEKARKIYIIGYSLPKYDKEEFTCLCENISENTEITIIDVFGENESFASKYTEIKDKYSDILKKKVNVDLGGFEKFVL